MKMILIVTVGIAVLWIPEACAQKPPETTFTSGTSADAKQLQRDVSQITARELAAVHVALCRRCVKHLPSKCELNYCGSLRYNNGRLKSEVLGDSEGSALLSWHIQDEDFVVFSVRLSLAKSPEAITSFVVDGKELFLKVDFVDENQRTDKPLARLGGKSVRDVLLLLNAKDSPSDEKP